MKPQKNIKTPYDNKRNDRANRLHTLVRILLYFTRWQLAGILIYPFSLWIITDKFWAIIFGNTWGACLFFFVDRWLTKKA